MANTPKIDHTSRSTLAHVKLIDHQKLDLGRRNSIGGEIAGISLRVSLTTDRHGRPGATVVMSHKIGRMRASGKGFEYWKNQSSVSIKRTADDLVVARVFHETNANKHRTSHIFLGTDLMHVLFHIINTGADEIDRISDHNDDLRDHLMNENVQIVLDTGFEDYIADGGSRASRSRLNTFLLEGIMAHLGELPSWDERFPMLRSDSKQSVRRTRPADYLMFLDAQDPSDVARRLFGKRAYIKPLGRAVAGALEVNEISMLRWFSLYRGLVPIEAIVSAIESEVAAVDMSSRMRDFNRSMQLPKSSTLRNVRALLRRLPAPVLRRLLSEPYSDSLRSLGDAGASIGDALITMRDINLIGELVTLRGQKNLRGARDVEDLIRRAPQVDAHAYARGKKPVLVKEEEQYQQMSHYNNQMQLVGRRRVTWQDWKDPEFQKNAEIELTAMRNQVRAARDREYARQQEERRQQQLIINAERHQWALAKAGEIAALTIEGYDVVVASDPEELSRWGATMKNCIGDSMMGYKAALELDIFVAISEKSSGQMMVNMHITQEGIQQMLGKRNRDLDEVLDSATAQRMVDAFTAIDIRSSRRTLGLRNLLTPAMV